MTKSPTVVPIASACARVLPLDMTALEATNLGLRGVGKNLNARKAFKVRNAHGDLRHAGYLIGGQGDNSKGADAIVRGQRT